MPSGPWHRLLEVVRRRADPDATGPMADERLLARFVANGDPSAFELLVWRHGSLVYGTCRRVLGDAHTAEDAFQATFLALARKPRAVRSGAALAGWLHRVALRVANKLRASQARRNRAEQSAAQAYAVTPTHLEQTEIAAVVDEEIDRLPDRLRRAVVLCYLDGRTTEQAAQMLGCPRGTVLSRLSTARERLRGQLTRRGLALPVTGISTLIFASESPASLVSNTVRAVLTGASPLLTGLVQGVFHAMFITKVKIATATMLVLGLVGAGVGWIVVPGSGHADERLAQQKPAPEAPFDHQARAYAQKIQRSYELILEAKRTVAEKLEHAEQAHADFRKKAPPSYIRGSVNFVRLRLDPIETKLTELKIKEAEVGIRLSFLEKYLKSGGDQKAKNGAAEEALVNLQMRGVDVPALKKIPATMESRFPAGVNFEGMVIQAYSEALQSELLDINMTRMALTELLSREENELREIQSFELQDQRLRNAISQNRQLLDSIVKRLSEINLEKDAFLK